MEGVILGGIIALVFGTYIVGCPIVGGFIMLILVVDCVAGDGDRLWANPGEVNI